MNKAILFSCLFFLNFFIACGGGGDDNPTTNTPPLAVAGSDRIVNQGDEVSLDGSSSNDSDGQITSYLWAQLSGTPVDLTGSGTKTALFSAPVLDDRENLVFQLTVQDDVGAQHSDTVTITVNVPPTAVALSNPDQPLQLAPTGSHTITLTGVSSDSDGTIVAHQWLQTGGNEVDLINASSDTATFIVDGSATQAYTFSYTVTDNDGDQQSDTVSVYVTRIIFSDAFDDGNNWTSRWTIHDDTDNGADWTVEVESDQIGNRVLRQSANLERVEGGDPKRLFFKKSSDHLGSYVRLHDGSTTKTSSYRFSVDITPLPDINYDDKSVGNDVGIMFGFNGFNDYYRVSMSARYGFTRFEKFNGREFRTLAVNSIGYVYSPDDPQTISMMAEVNGETLVVWIDGDPVFAAVEPSPVHSATVGLYCQARTQFDNVVITDNPLYPQVVISKPLAYSVALTQDDDNTLPVEAVVLNPPVGGSVSFNLFSSNNSSEFIATTVDTQSVYAVDFVEVADGEHELMVVLKDADGKELGIDINSTVGIGGDYYVTVGDSITNGVGDQDPTNNDSDDGRIVSIQGYQAVLADLLTKRTARPQIIFNEGISGDRSADLSSRINSILNRHPMANKVLLLIGTNDARPGADQVNRDVYRENVLSIVSNVNGRQVWLAKLPATNGDNLRNQRILEFNQEIQIIADSADNDNFLGPDFYIAFENKPELFSGTLHPNDAGYQVMAEEWDKLLP